MLDRVRNNSVFNTFVQSVYGLLSTQASADTDNAEFLFHTEEKKETLKGFVSIHVDDKICSATPEFAEKEEEESR